MKNAYLWVGLLAVAIVGLMLFLNSSSDYVVVVDQEITELENELADLEAQVAAGTLTPEAAAEAQVKIVKRLESISTSVQNGQKAKLTDAQRVQLNDGLERLKKVLLNYQTTLVAVDAQVETLPEAERPKLNKGGSSRSRTLTETVVETVTEVEDIVEEIVEDYDETPIEELFEENASSSGDTMDDESATTTDEEEGEVTEEESIDSESEEEMSDTEETESTSDEDPMMDESTDTTSGVNMTDESGTTTQ